MRANASVLRAAEIAVVAKHSVAGRESVSPQPPVEAVSKTLLPALCTSASFDVIDRQEHRVSFSAALANVASVRGENCVSNLRGAFLHTSFVALVFLWRAIRLVALCAHLFWVRPVSLERIEAVLLCVLRVSSRLVNGSAIHVAPRAKRAVRLHAVASSSVLLKLADRLRESASAAPLRRF